MSGSRDGARQHRGGEVFTPTLSPDELATGLMLADQILTRYGQIANEFGSTIEAVREAVHEAKDGAEILRGGSQRNQDVGVDRATGAIYLPLPGGGYSDDPIGHIEDYLKGPR